MAAYLMPKLRPALRNNPFYSIACSLLWVCLSVGFTSRLGGQCAVNATFDLTGQPAGVATSASISRDQKCCGSNSNDCVSFNVILDPGSVGLKFEEFGANAGGVLYYQINCGPPTSVGQSICLQGGQSYNITYCKPGSNEYFYKITAIPDLIVADAAIKAGCSSQLVAQMPGSGGSISWSGTDPATNAWLSCTNCPTPTITPPLNTPLTSVTYNVTWTGTNFACSSPISSTKQVTVSIVPPPTLSISPAAPRFCANAISAISANVAGAGTYLVRWFSGSNATGAQIGTGPTFTPPATAGTTAYSVRVEDVSNPCNFTVSNFNVQIDPAPVFDIPDITLCVDDERRVTLSTQNTYSWSSTSGIRAYPNAVYGITSAASGTPTAASSASTRTACPGTPRQLAWAATPTLAAPHAHPTQGNINNNQQWRVKKAG